MKKLMILPPIHAAVLLLLASCGGGDDNPTAPGDEEPAQAPPAEEQPQEPEEQPREPVVLEESAVLEGHEDRVNSVSFSPDGRTLASGGTMIVEDEDRHSVGIIQLWDVASRTQTAVLEEHSGLEGHSSVSSVSFSPDGQTLASTGYYIIRLWDVASRTQTAVLLDADAREVSFSPDGLTLASADGGRNTVRLWDVASGTLTAVFGRHTSIVSSVSFSPDGRTLASGSWDNTVRLWDVASGTQTAVFGGRRSVPGDEARSAYIYSVSFSPDGRTLVAGTNWGGVWLCDLASVLAQKFVHKVA